MPNGQSRQETSAIGLLLASLALVMQLALGAAADAPADGDRALDAVAVMCLAATPADHPNAPHPHPADHTLCPLCVALATLPADAPALPGPSSHAFAQRRLPPPGQGPPAQPRRTDLPRGPPVLT